MANYQVVDRCDFQPGQNVNGRYTVMKTLGEGSFGVVYLVEDSRGSKYALKLLRLWEVPSEIRQPLIDRFEMEYQTGQIASDNLVQSLDYGKVGGNPFIVMEFCPGGDLERLLGKAGYRAPRICQEVLSGLKALHNHGKVHRDLKPENVLFKESGVAALTDFGIAGDRTHRMTQRNIFIRLNKDALTYNDPDFVINYADIRCADGPVTPATFGTPTFADGKITVPVTSTMEGVGLALDNDRISLLAVLPDKGVSLFAEVDRADASQLEIEVPAAYLADEDPVAELYGFTRTTVSEDTFVPAYNGNMYPNMSSNSTHIATLNLH